MGDFAGLTVQSLHGWERAVGVGQRLFCITADVPRLAVYAFSIC